jgi:hypothetical protein
MEKLATIERSSISLRNFERPVYALEKVGSTRDLEYVLRDATGETGA